MGLGLGAGGDVGAAAPDVCLRRVVLRCFDVGLVCLGNLVVDSCGARHRDPHGMFCVVSVFGSLPYKLANTFLPYQ